MCSTFNGRRGARSLSPPSAFRTRSSPQVRRCRARRAAPRPCRRWAQRRALIGASSARRTSPARAAPACSSGRAHRACTAHLHAPGVPQCVCSGATGVDRLTCDARHAEMAAVFNTLDGILKEGWKHGPLGCLGTCDPNSVPCKTGAWRKGRLAAGSRLRAQRSARAAPHLAARAPRTAANMRVGAQAPIWGRVAARWAVNCGPSKFPLMHMRGCSVVVRYAQPQPRAARPRGARLRAVSLRAPGARFGRCGLVWSSNAVPATDGVVTRSAGRLPVPLHPVRHHRQGAGPQLHPGLLLRGCASRGVASALQAPRLTLSNRARSALHALRRLCAAPPPEEGRHHHRLPAGLVLPALRDHAERQRGGRGCHLLALDPEGPAQAAHGAGHQQGCVRSLRCGCLVLPAC